MNRTSPARRALLAVAAALAAGALVPAAFAQSDRAVRFILPNAVGSGVDAITRSVQPALAKALGHSVVVDNQPGAGGIVGLQALARSAPDGYTPVVLVVNPKVPATNAKELVALLKARGDDMNYASGGNGTILHLATAMFLDEAGVKARHIPYKGVGPMLTDLLGGQVQFATAALPSVQQHLKSGALRAIGMATEKRVAAAPEIPTFVEQGMPNYVVEAWFALIGPKGLPPADVQRIHAALVAAFNDPAVKDSMAKQGNVINISPAEMAMPFFRSELEKYAQLVKKAGVEAQ
jgi:tripartite-type tricarboxylate transporter receptor subunit TctC